MSRIFKALIIALGVLLASANVVYAAPVIQNFTNIAPFLNDIYDNGTSTPSQEWLHVYTKILCLSGDCRSVWPTSGGGGSGTVGTSTNETAGFLAYWTTNSATPALLGKVATTSTTLASELSFSGTLGARVGGTSGTLSLTTNGTALSKLVQIGANTILGNATGATGNVTAFATSTLGIAISDTTGTLTVARGGTGVATITGLIKGNGTSPFTAASNGTDFTLTSANTCSAGQHISALTAAGGSTCSPDTGAGGTGLATTSPTLPGGVLWYNGTGNGFASTVATSTLTATGAISISNAPSIIGGSGAVITLGTVGIANGGTATTTGGNTNGVEYYDGTEITNNPNLAFDSSINQLSIPRINLSATAGSPTLGIYDNSGNLGFSVGGSNRFNMSSTLLASATAGAGGFLTAATSGTSPAFVPNKSDTTTGVGADSSGNLSLITSATTKVELLNNGNLGIGSSTPGSLLSIGGSGTGTNFYDNATTSKNGVGGYNIAQGCYAVAGVCLTSGSGGGVTSIQQTGGGTAQTGAITFSTTTDSFNGLQANENITNSGGAFTFANNITGTLNVTGGGTGLSSLASGSLAYGSGSTALTALAAGTPGQVLGIVGGVPAWVATSTGSSGSGTVNTGTQGQVAFYNANGTAVSGTSTITIAQNKTVSFNSDFVHMGTTTCNLGLVGNGSSGAEICGNTNTPGGLILQVENDSNSPSAFDGLNFDNDQSTTALTFGGVFFNSSTYNFTGYGTALAVPSNLSLENTQGSVSIIGASTTPAGAYINFLTGGPNTNNEAARIIANGNFGIGSVTPSAHLSIDSASSTPTEASLIIADRGSPIYSVASSSVTSVGVGTTTPWRTLSVVGTVAFPTLTSSSGLQSGVLCLSANGEVINDSVACLASAARYKQDISSLSLGASLKELMQIRPVSFYYKPDFNGALQSNPNDNSEQVGFIADEVQKIDPRLVILTTEPTTFEGQTYPAGTVNGVRYEQITALLAAAAQAQQKELNKLGWGWGMLLVLLMMGFGYQQVQINQLKKK